MSVFNRKMFKPRNARNALSMSAGIMPVQKFNAGGLAALKRFNHGGSVHMGTRPRTMGTTSNRSGLPGAYTAPNYSGVSAVGKPIAEIAQRYISGQPVSAREFSQLQGAETSFLAGKDVENLGKGTRIGEGIASFLKPVAQGIGGATGYTKGALSSASKYLFGDPSGQTPPTPEVNLQPIGGLRDLTLGKDGKPINPDGESPEDYNKRVNAAMAAARPSASGTFGQRVNSAGQPQLNIDYLKSIGIDFLDPANLQTASSRGGPVPPSAFGKAVPPPAAPKSQEELDADAMRAAELNKEEAIARAEMDRIGSVVGNEEAGLSPTGFLPTTTPSLESATDNALTTSDSSPEPVDQMFMGLGDAPPPEGDDTSTSTTKGGADGTDGSDGAPTSEEEIKRVINSGTKEEQQSTLDGFIKEFMDKAPGYEGADSGLILAKIGFAMAAGKSPNAIENIASAMSDGADMLIKDKAKKDEFNRQLKLSAMQYGFTETGKLRAEDRLEAREGRGLNYFVAEGDVTINGKKYKKGNTVPVSTAFIRENGLPAELQSTELAKAAMTTNAAYQKALLKAKEKNIIDPKTYVGLVEGLNEASVDFQSANSMRSLVEGNIIRNAENRITGFGPAFNTLLNNAYNSVGAKAPSEYEDVQKYNQDMRRVSNLLLKDLLGEGSKNVSNIDRKLADEIVGLYAGVGGYITADPDLLNERLQNILVTLDGKEKGALNVFRGASESTEGFTFRSGKAVNLNIPAEAKVALGEQNVQGLIKYGVGDDGVYRRLS